MDLLPPRDGLTGALARSGFAPALRAAVAHQRTFGDPCSLLVFDIDHFKSVNDAFGHARGDGVLVEVVERVRQVTRAADQVFRYGGDEFVVLLARTAKPDAVRLAERLLAAVRDRPFAGDVPLNLSLSIGVASCPADASDDHALFQVADSRNYEAKRRGRACVVADDRVQARELAFTGGRLLERDESLARAQAFLQALAGRRRSVLPILGAAGTGRTRFLAAVAQQAELQGCAVLMLAGGPDSLRRPYAALAQALPGLLPPAAPAVLTLPDLLSAANAYAASAGAAQLLVCVDDLASLDWGSSDLLRQLLGSDGPPPVGLAYTADVTQGRRAAPLAAHAESPVVLQPLSQAGLHVWLRTLLASEPPHAFTEWLFLHTGGNPGHVEQTLTHLQSTGALEHRGAGWQVGASYAASDLTPHRAGRATPHNLPAPLTRFVARERERADVRQLLATARLVTLSGAGGIGKTRLALEVGAELLDAFADGVWVVELAAVTDPGAVAASVAAALGVRAEAHEPPLAGVVAWLRTRQVLLVLDNCEHLIDACAVLADSLLRAAPDIRLVATSREPLDIAGERVYRVPPLMVPHEASTAPDELLQYAAVQLFADRAALADHLFRLTDASAPLVAQICTRLDGIPLALELAAAQLRSIELGEIAGGIADRFRLLASGNRAALPRHQTLRALIDWSHDLLTDAERALFRRLGVFRGGWTADVVAEICGQPGADAAGLLDRLAMASLVTVSADEPARYSLLETIRHYAWEQLGAAGERDELRTRHLARFLALAEEAEPHLLTGERGRWLDRLDQDHENLRAALEWGCLSQLEGAQRLAGALGWYWYFSDHLNEGRSWCARILAQGGAAQPRAGLAKLLTSAGMIAANLAFSDEAQALLARALAQCREDGERALLSEVVFHLGYVQVQLGQDARACALFAEHEAWLADCAPPLILSYLLSYWGRALARASGDYAGAKALHDRSVAIGNATGDPMVLAPAAMNLGQWAAEQADYAAACAYHSEALAWRRQSGSRLHIAISAHYVADMLSMQGELARAAALYAEALALSRSLGDQSFIAWTAYRLGYVMIHQGKSQQAHALLAESLAIYAPRGDEDLLTSCLAGCAELARAGGNLRAAARLLGFISAHTQAPQRLFISPIDAAEYERTAAAVRSLLEPDAFAAAWEAGAALSGAEAVAEAVRAVRG